MRGPVRIVLGTLLLALALAGVGLAPAPAGATSGYCTGPGVDVVVDFGALGGGVQKYCAAGSGSRTAQSAFDAAGVDLTFVQRFPGAVCRVQGKPAGAGCSNMPPADAYWGLFFSHGSGWTFSSQGVVSLRVSSGDTVAFAWQASSGTRRPATSPAPHVVAPTRTPTPTSAPGGSGGKHHAGSSPAPAGSGSTGAGASAAASSTAKPGRHRPHASASPTAGATSSTPPSATASVGAAAAPASTTDPASSDDGGGLPWWVPVGIVVVLAAGGGAAVLVRRRSAG
jgi:hypothetical protein